MRTLINRLVRRIQHARAEQERGMSLIELLVYIVLTALMVTLITTLVISVSRASTQVRLNSESSNTSQALLERLQLNLRNATALTAKADGANLLVIATVRSNTDGIENAEDMRCVGFYFDQAAGKVHSTTSETGSTTATKTAFTTPVSAKSWPVAATGVFKDGATSVVNTASSSASILFQSTRGAQTQPVQYKASVPLQLGGQTQGCF